MHKTFKKVVALILSGVMCAGILLGGKSLKAAAISGPEALAGAPVTITALEDTMEHSVIAKDTNTFYWNNGNGLSGRILKLLQQNPDFVLVFEFPYKDVAHTLVIKGADLVGEEITEAWYGPEILIAAFEAPTTYTVVKGDNLNKIAAKCGTTLAALKKLNPTIKDVNLIYPGQVIVIK